MSLTEALITSDRIECQYNDEVIPNHNLIYNIDHMISFIEIDIKNWSNHVDQLNKDFAGADDLYISLVLLKECNVRFYLKSLFSVATCYIALIDAFKQLNSQLQNLNRICGCNVKKPTIDTSTEWYDKVRYVRNISYIHQNSKKEPNTLNKSQAMTWNPVIFTSVGVTPTCESYCFGEWKYKQTINNEETLSDANIAISGFSKFAETALDNAAEIRSGLIAFHKEIKHRKSSKNVSVGRSSS